MSAPAACWTEAEDDAAWPVDPEMVGVWTGTIRGTLGNETFTMDLFNDGTIRARGETNNYCTVDGLWGLPDGDFRAETVAFCNQSTFTFDAPFSTSELAGSWVTSAGDLGSFRVSKP